MTIQARDLTAPGSAATGRPAARNLAYLLLAVFNVVTVLSALWLSHQLMDIYRDSVTANASWVERSGRYAQLDALTGDISAPASTDLFQSRDVPRERARTAQARRAFDAYLKALRQDLDADVPEPSRSELGARFDRIALGSQRMVEASERVFEAFQRGDLRAAGARMAALDGVHEGVEEQINLLRDHVRLLQQALLHEQLVAAEHLRGIETLIAAMILLMIGAALFHGRRSARQQLRHAQERERHIAQLQQAQHALAAAHADLEDRVQQRTTELAASEARARAIVANAHDAFVGMDDRGLVTDWNPQAEALFGWTAAEAIGQLLGTLIIPAPLRERHANGLQRFLATGEGPMLDTLVQLPALHRDGRELPVELTISAIRTDGTHAFSAFLRDISERKRAEEIQARFAAIIAFSASAIMSKTLDGIVTSWNPGAEALFGYAADEVVGQPMAILVPPERAQEEPQMLARIGRGERIEQFETVRVHKDGTRLDVAVTLSPIRDTAGTIIGASKIVHDISARKRAQDELDRFFRLSLDMLCIASYDGYFLRLNPAWERTLGYTSAELMAQPFIDLVHPDDRAATLVVARQLAEGIETRAFENRYRCKDGSWKWLVWQAAPTADQSLIYAAAHDITERHLAEQELQAQASRLTEAQYIARLGNWEWDVAVDAVTWSEQMYRVFGVTPAQFTPTYAGFLALVHPDDRDSVQAQVGRSLGEQVSVNFEHRVLLGDGSIRHIHARTRAVLDANGTVARLVGTAQDITERTRVQEALRLSEERFQIVARATNDVIWDWDLANGSVWFSDVLGSSFGYAPGDYDPTIDFRIQNIHPDDRERVLHGLDAFAAGGGEAWSDEYRFRCGDGRFAYVFDRAIAQRDAQGAATRMVGSMMNITAQKQQEIELLHAKDAAEAASRAKSDFLANMSHEIRTPMNGVLGTLGLLLDSELTSSQRELAGLARASGETLLGLINDILDFSKIEAGKLSLEAIPFDLLRAAEGVADMMATLAAGKDLDLVLRYAPDVPRHVVGDPGRIRQVLTNLLGNAIKFTDRGQVLLDIQALAQDATSVSLRIRVEDTGIGIAPDQLEHLFGKFTQADTSTTRRHGGTGLGLAITSQLVGMMGGQVGAESQPGEGATFWFTLTLPLQADAPPEPPPPADLQGVRVLIVDDNAVNRRVLHEQVVGWKMRNGSCMSADEALRILRQAHADGDPYGIAILDYQMPGTDGEMLGRAIKADPDLRDVVLLMLTSMGHRGDVARLKQLGFAAYLVKPTRQSELLAALSRVWSAHMHERDMPMVTRHTLIEDHAHGGGESLPQRTFHARVLLAEDHPTNQIVASMMLRNLGCTVDLAGNGREAVAMLEASTYDVVFMDCEMPVLDGFEATAEIRLRGDAKARVPIVAVTAQAMQGDRERCLRAGMDDYISKPVQSTAFAAALQRWAPACAVEPALPAAPPGAGTVPAAAPRVADALDGEVLARLRALALATDPSLLEQIFASFQRDGAARITALRDAQRHGDASTLRQAAHALKGASANIGARVLADLAGQLEAVLAIDTGPDAAALIDRLHAEFVRVAGAIAALQAADAGSP